MAESKTPENKLPEAPKAPEIAAPEAPVTEIFSDEFGMISMVPVRKPVAGVTQGTVPEGLAKLLAAHVPAALADKDHELQLTAKDETAAKKLALYARAWGAQQEPKLYIHKIPNRRDMPANVARLEVQLDSEVTAENRPGRKVQK